MDERSFALTQWKNHNSRSFCDFIADCFWNQKNGSFNTCEAAYSRRRKSIGVRMEQGPPPSIGQEYPLVKSSAMSVWSLFITYMVTIRIYGVSKKRKSTDLSWRQKDMGHGSKLYNDQWLYIYILLSLSLSLCIHTHIYIYTYRIYIYIDIYIYIYIRIKL